MRRRVELPPKHEPVVHQPYLVTCAREPKVASLGESIGRRLLAKRTVRQFIEQDADRRPHVQADQGTGWGNGAALGGGLSNPHEIDKNSDGNNPNEVTLFFFF